MSLAAQVVVVRRVRQGAALGFETVHGVDCAGAAHRWLIQARNRVQGRGLAPETVTQLLGPSADRGYQVHRLDRRDRRAWLVHRGSGLGQRDGWRRLEPRVELVCRGDGVAIIPPATAALLDAHLL